MGWDGFGMAKLSAILDQVDAGTVLLPEFQRGYVWNRDQVRGLMRSLYKGYPVGALLMWETDVAGQAVRGAAAVKGTRALLLDGQQRVTTLYGIIRGTPPPFFEGDLAAFQDLRFNVETEAFEFYGPVKMKDDPLWVDVTALFTGGPSAVAAGLQGHPTFFDFVDRLHRVRNVVEREVHVETITGPDKTLDVVVDIFNRVNSGGTKLSRGDLALARICSDWPQARPTMRAHLDRWRDQRGLQFTSDWLLRNVNAVATGRAPFSALETVSADAFRDALEKAVHNVDHLVDLMASTLGLDHDRVFIGRYAIPVLGRLLLNNNGRFADAFEAARALYWYVLAAVSGRFAGSAETSLARDLATVDRCGIDGVIDNLRLSRNGSLTIDPQDFEGAGRGSRSYPLLYLVARTSGARDLVTGRPFGIDAAAVEVCEIFPRALLAEAGYSRAQVNAVANYAFVTPSSSMALAGCDPQLYLAAMDPAVRASQWIPDGEWRVENYPEFLAARRTLLAAEANAFLTALSTCGLPRWLAPVTFITEDESVDYARMEEVDALVEELVRMGLTCPALDAEVPDPETGAVLAVAQAFWAEGLQAGQGAPVVLELDPDEADLPRFAELGYQVFVSVDALRGYVRRRNEVASGDRDTSGMKTADEPVPAAPEALHAGAIPHQLQAASA